MKKCLILLSFLSIVSYMSFAAENTPGKEKEYVFGWQYLVIPERDMVEYFAGRIADGSENPYGNIVSFKSDQDDIQMLENSLDMVFYV